MATSVLRNTIHSAVAKSILNEIGSRAVKYYFSYGRTYDWGGINVQDAEDTLPYELAARKNSVFVKEVTPGDACLVIPRYNWISGAVYDHYDAYSSTNVAFSGAKSLEEALYYVVTDELNVYKCLDNNNNSSSTIKPTGTSTTEITTSDGYVWKYMYTIPTALGNKFLSTTLMPVANAVNKMFYSDGKLEKFIIEAKGGGYIPNYTQEGTVSSDTGIGNLNYHKLYGVNTAFLGTDKTINKVTSTGTTSVTAVLDSTALTIQSFTGYGTGTVMGTVSSTAALGVNDYIYISGAAGQNILEVTSMVGNGSVNVTINTPSNISSIQQGEVLVISGASGAEASKLNGTWLITGKGSGYLTIAISLPLATGTYSTSGGTNIGTTLIPSRTALNGTWRITKILSGTTFEFSIGNGTLWLGTHKSSLGTSKYVNKYSLLRAGDYITISGAVGTEQSKLNGAHQITDVSGIDTITFSVTSALTTGEYTTDLGTAKHSSKITGLIPNDYIEVNGQVRQIASIESDTELTLKSTGPLLYVGQDSILTKLNTFLEIEDGDGFVEENPYIVTSINVIEGGSQYTANTGPNPSNTTVTFSQPQLIGGRVATGTVTVSGGIVTGITLTDPGYGYTARPTATINDNTPGGQGSGAVLQVVVEKSTAYLEPSINLETGEIVNIVPKVTGIGYTYGVITPRRYNTMTLPTYLTSWPDAKVSADFSLGKLDTKQADVELSAINGGIHFIKVTTAGIGYAQGEGAVTITGDGTGCTAIPGFTVDGVLNRIIITNPGKDYTFANVSIARGAQTSTEAVARAIISPTEGHGKSAIDELGGRTLSLFNRLAYDTKLKAMSLNDVSYRQLVLIRQPRAFGAQTLYNNSIGSTCYKVVVTPKTVGNNTAPAVTTIPVNSELVASEFPGGATSIKFRLIARTTNEMLLQAIDNNDEQLTTNLVLVHPNGTNSYTINAIEKPDVEKLSGDVIYIDNRQEFKPLADQTVSISSRFRF